MTLIAPEQFANSSTDPSRIFLVAVFGRAANSVIFFYRRDAAGKYENNVTSILTYIYR